jgi:hypothetical protein
MCDNRELRNACGPRSKDEKNDDRYCIMRHQFVPFTNMKNINVRGGGGEGGNSSAIVINMYCVS